MKKLKRVFTSSLFAATLIIGAGGAGASAIDVEHQVAKDNGIVTFKKDPGTLG
ncbi:hypothetical protein [Peribacillus aracenensis]|uniref:hypothetical protein n=1 Tax=Peribacillus aracenensis TaxID=2976708 RepID=UPI0021A7CF1C|nr:hypothetical protein [Peribacillus sp. BBB004]